MSEGESRSRHARARAVFLEASRAEALERDALLAARCAGDDALLADVRALLEGDAGATGFLDRPALALPDAIAPDRRLPERIGSYRVRRKLGEGGMGTVFEAEQENPRRVVALKVLHPSITSASTRHRFERETRLLAKLHHPGIAQIYEAGEADTDFGDQPYFAMELVEGVSLTEYARREDLDANARLALFSRVCDAVQHAHDRGVVHRDLKPGNVLVDATGQPKVLDFGIARLLDREGTAFTSALTAEQSVLGTVPYLAPEQAAGRASEIDGRADVYSLGVVLYELMTGDLPYDVRARPVAEAIRIVLEHDPTPPGTRLKALRGDVETIIGKTLEKEPARRYATASALAADVRRHLRNEPIEARPPSVAYRVSRFVRRNRAVVAGTLATFATLVAGTVVALKLAWDEREARTASDANAYRSNVLSAASAIEAGDLGAARTQLDRAPERLRAWEWRHLDRGFDGSLTKLRAENAGQFTDVAFGADGRRVSAVTQNGGVLTWDVQTGELLSVVATPAEGLGAAFALGPGADSCVVADTKRGVVRVLETLTGRSLVEMNTPCSGFIGAAWSPRAGRVATRPLGQRFVQLLDPARSGDKVVKQWAAGGTWRSGQVFSPDGSLFAFSDERAYVHVVDAATGTDRFAFEEPASAWALAFDSKVERLAVGVGQHYPSPYGACAVYDVASGRCVLRIPFRSSPANDIAFSPDGSRLAIGAFWGSVHEFDAASGEKIAEHRSYSGYVRAIDYSPTGSRSPPPRRAARRHSSRRAAAPPRSRRSAGTGATSTPARSARTGRRSPRARGTAPSSSGTLRRRPRSRRSAATSTT